MPKKRFDLKTNNKISSFNKIIKVDSDKSISIRSFLIGAISKKISTARNVLESEDVFSAIKCLKKLGVKIYKNNNKYFIRGRGLTSLKSGKNSLLNFGNSGTLARLLIGILSTTPKISIKMTGDHSLKKRNMKSLIVLMNKFGASFFPKNKFKFPLKMISSNNAKGINYKAGVSAQLKSAVILAGLNADGVTKIFENYKSRNHTENILAQNSKVIKFKKKRNIIIAFGKKSLKPLNIDVPGDPSSAAFFTALTLLNKNSSLKIKNVGLNPTRIGFYKLLKKQNAKIKFNNTRKIKSEKIGDIVIKSCSLKPIIASKEFYVNSTDEYPILFVIASLIKGISIFKGIGDLKNKESNRILEMQKILKQIGVKSTFNQSQIKIFGKGMIDASNKKILVSNLGDHRICMSAFILGILTGAKTKIKNFETVFTSSPSFLKIMKNLGARYEVKK